MELHIPNYYSRFHCLAGECPHTCCALWEVPVSEDYAAFCRGAPGPLGDRLRALLAPDGEGGLCLPLAGGKCPLLDEKGLCSLQLAWGEGSIPPVCREHPRFSYDYGPLREMGLCASCPEAARLILAEDPVLSVQTVSQQEQEDVAHPLLSPLLLARETALALLGDPALSLSCRLQALLLFANEAQNCADEENWAALPGLCGAYAQAVPQVDPAALPSRREVLDQILDTLGGLEVLRPDWSGLLQAARAELGRGRSLPSPPETEGARAAAYFVYRHWLRALNDGDVLTWAEFAVLGTAVAGALAPLEAEGFSGVFRRLCLELEHCQENLNALQDDLWQELTLPQLLALAAKK